MTESFENLDIILLFKMRSICSLANCLCASLLRTQFHTPRNTGERARAKY